MGRLEGHRRHPVAAAVLAETVPHGNLSARKPRIRSVARPGNGERPAERGPADETRRANLTLYLRWKGTRASPRGTRPPGAGRSALNLLEMSLRRLLVLAALSGPCLVAPGSAPAQLPPERSGYLGGQVIVHYRAGTEEATQTAVESRTGTREDDALPGESKRLAILDGQSVHDTVAELRLDPSVEYAVPNYVARASAFPNDRGYSLQWNFWGPFGINLPEAWSLARRRKAPGGRGAVVAVLDTGVAYRKLGRFRRAPDLRSFVRGYDFVSGDRYPLDLNGHGTHVSGTIAEATNNGIGAAGIAYAARIMPVRTLDAFGSGDAVTVSRGIRYAVRRHADVINLSLEFAPLVGAREVPDVMAALRYARRHRVVVTAVAGNGADTSVIPYPARANEVIAVAATTERGCHAEYSNAGADVDVAAPGGGPDAAPMDGDPWDLAHCQPGLEGRSIYQQTFGPNFARFALPSGYYGTSMAAPHVAGLAALIIASRRLGRNPQPAAVQRLIERTARDAGPPGFDIRYGHGLIDAAAALR
jgi:serine protease